MALNRAECIKTQIEYGKVVLSKNPKDKGKRVVRIGTCGTYPVIEMGSLTRGR